MRRFSFILFLLMLMIPIISGSVYAADQEISTTLKHVDTAIFNEYVSALIKAREADMKAAVTQEKGITDFTLRDADFDIMSGKILIKFILYKGKTDISGALQFEVRISNDGIRSTDGAPKIGAYCLGLDGKLHSSKFFANLFLGLAKKAIHKRLSGTQFWSDQQDHPQYMVFKNENLAAIVNQTFIETLAGKGQFQKISQEFPGGVAEVEFTNLTCNLFDIARGQAEITAGLAGVIKFALFGENKIDNAGTLKANFDFYIDPQDRSWWAKLSQFKLQLNILTPTFNDLLQEIIDQELISREILIPIDMPRLDQV